MVVDQGKRNPCRVIAFYLPQFHPIPENDSWWGEGFTEWVNVRKAEPRFAGHYQPHLPGELGYYDLRDSQVRQAQADLARAYGIHGFCYYHYWFNGRMLLERPFNEVLASGKPDFPFCLCWANENWTRAWDGLEREVLIAQDYRHYNHMAHFDWLAKAFDDSRYIRIDGKPLFLIYRVEQIPQLKNVLDDWRRVAAERGMPGIYVCGVNNMQLSLKWKEFDRLGVDALVDFQPNPRDVAAAHGDGVFAWFGKALRLFERLLQPRMRGVFRYNYEKIVKAAIARPSADRRLIPAVFPSWDNSPRRRTNVTVIQNDDATLYGRWLSDAVKRTSALPEAERLVFINAWNEWGEGCHLEPDIRNGHRFLDATRRVVLGEGPVP
jgi:lipopolysaccharide biosynthesis protein